MNQPPNNMIGWTDDGKVFMVMNSILEGKPIQMTIQWNPNDALNIVEGIRQAIEGIRGEKDGGNGKNPD